MAKTKISNGVKILITGGEGFVGSHLAGALAKMGHRVVVVGYQKSYGRNAKFYKADICSSMIESIFKIERPEIVYHLAADPFVALSPSAETSNKIFRTNIIGSFNIIEASRKYNVKKIIFASSAAVYGAQRSRLLAENNSTKPLSFYGQSKLIVEQILKIYYKIYKLPYIAFRYANIYGPGQKLTAGTAIVNIINKLLLNERPLINGTGEQIRDYIYVDDVTNANLMAMRTKGVGVYNVGTGKGASLNNLFYKIRKLLKKDIQPQYDISAKTAPATMILDVTKIKKEIGWRHKVSLDKGLQKTIIYFQKQRPFKRHHFSKR